LVREPEGKRPLGRTGRRSVDYIKMNLEEIEWDGVDWIYLAHDRVKWRAAINSVMNPRDSKMQGNYRVALQLASTGVVLSIIHLVSSKNN
jgi:hypothetical protein